MVADFFIALFLLKSLLHTEQRPLCNLKKNIKGGKQSNIDLN